MKLNVKLDNIFIVLKYFCYNSQNFYNDNIWTLNLRN